MRILLLALFLSCSALAGAWLNADYVIATATSSTTIVTTGFTTTTGNLNVGFVAISDAANTATIVSIIDTEGNNYILGTRKNADSNTSYMFYAKNITGASIQVITVTLNGSFAFRSLHVYQFSGADTTAPFDVEAVPSSGTGTVMTSNTFTTNCDNEQLVAFGPTTGNITNGTGYTVRSAQNYAAGEEKHVTSPQTGVTAVMTTDTSTTWHMHVMAFKDVGATCSGGGGARRRVVIIQ